MKKHIKTDRLKDTFLEIVQIDTGSDSDSQNTPSTQKQMILAELLAKKLKDLGLKDIELKPTGIVTGKLLSNIGENTPVMGLMAHMDTSPDVMTGPVKPQIHNYNGGDIHLTDDVCITSSNLQKYVGHTIITSDGTTLLGADDKAGIAEILETLSVLQDNPSLPHSELRVAFTPDEEVGRGTENFDIKAFGADFAYTVDGSAPVDIDTETFNAYNPRLVIKGVPVHCGYAYGKMISAVELAMEFMNALPKDETPATTKNREGYYHVTNISGSPAEIVIDMIVRDFENEGILNRIGFLRRQVELLQQKYPQAKLEFSPNESYHNMKEYFSEFPMVISLAEIAVSKSGLQAQQTSIRGGTDGAELTRKGLLTPNLGAGGENFHSLNEFVSLQTMEKCTEILLNLVQAVAEESNNLMPEIIKRRSLRSQSLEG